MAFTENCSARLLKELTGQQQNGPLPTCYLALSTTPPNAAGGNFTEPPGSTGYARTLLGTYNSPSTFIMSAPSGGTTTNTDIIFFPEATASWGSITHFGLFDAKTGGNLMVYGQLSAPVTVPANYVPLFRAGYFTMSIV